jgi:WD40 repeat protein
MKLEGTDMAIPGHNSRVYSCKYDKDDPNIMLTGGWDYRVLIWDLRA